jgi:hypothetical protein
MDGDSVPDNYQLYGKISVGPLAKSTSVTTQTKRGKIVWNEVLNFPILVSPLQSTAVDILIKQSNFIFVYLEY